MQGKDIESVNIIRAFFKLALVGGDVQKFLELVGVGGTGKSTLIRLLVAFIGKKNHTVTDLKNLETNRFEAASLYGKRLAVINDSSRYGGEVSLLKAITGGDPVRLEKKNQQQSGSFEYDGVVVIECIDVGCQLTVEKPVCRTVAKLFCSHYGLLKWRSISEH